MSRKNNLKKFTFKRFMRTVALVLATAAVAAVMVFAFGGLEFKSPFDKELNENNLLKKNMYNQTLPETNGYDLKMSWKDNGSITVYGKNENPNIQENEVEYIDFATVALGAGTYTLSGYDKGQLNTLGLAVSVDGGEYQVGNGKFVTFTLTGDSVCTIALYVGKDKTFFNARVYPTLVSGTEAGSFFAD